MKKINNIIKEFKSQLKKLYGKKLKDIILYGSWARNEAHENSDIDLIVVLRKDIKPGKEIDRMIDIITEINLKHNVLLSIYPISEKNYLTLKSPLLLNVRREGIVS
jgi:predicted nucleotidyltransferase